MKTTREFFVECLKAEGPKFIRVLKAIPPDKASYKPHERCSSAADIAWLLASELHDARESGCMHVEQRPHQLPDAGEGPRVGRSTQGLE